MRAWTVDADDIQVADDLTTRELHQTPGIEAFLAPHRGRSFRQRTISSSTAASSCRGLDSGRRDRGTRPLAPCSPYRASHS